MKKILNQKILNIKISTKKLLPKNNKPPKNKRAFLRASLTIEASLTLPIVIFAMALLMMPFRIMNEEREKLATLDSQTKLASRLMETEEVITLRDQIVVNKGSKSLFTGTRFQQEVVSSRRPWVGKKGSSGGEGTAGEDEDETYVWVCQGSDVYHGADCFHIFKDFSITTVEDAKAAGCQPCDNCAKNVTSGAVYVLPGMNKYHSSTSCSSMNWKASKMKKSEAIAQGLSPCSHCGGE